MKRKVMFVASTYSHIVNFHRPYLRKFRDEGYFVCVACGGKVIDIPEADEVLDLPFTKSFTSPDNFKAALMLRQKINSEEYDILSLHTTLAAFFARAALFGLAKRPFVVNMAHGYLFDGQTPWLKRNILLAAEKITAGYTDLLLVMNACDYEIAQKYKLGKKIGFIPGIGVDFSRFDTAANARQTIRRQYGVKESDVLLIYAAEFSARKSQSVLIRALKELPENVLLALAGDGVTRKECEALAEKLGLKDRTLFLGHASNMWEIYAAADIAVSASRSEGAPFNVMEAMYSGLSVIASRVKGHTDLIDDGGNGLLYQYGDEKELAEKVEELIASPDLRRSLAKNAKARIEAYSLDNVFEKVWAYYAEAVAGFDVVKRTVDNRYKVLLDHEQS